MIYVNSVSVTPKTIEIEERKWSDRARAEICPTNATCCEVTWSSSNTNVATVNERTGRIYGKAPGTAKIIATATDGSRKSDFLTVTVKNIVEVESIIISKKNLSTNVDSTVRLSATIYPKDATYKDLIWTSSDTNIAIVHENGVINAKNVGTCTIYASASDDSGVKASCEVIVLEKILVTDVFISSCMVLGKEKSSYVRFKAVLPYEASDRSLEWTSNNPNVATVDENTGLIYAKSLGEARITATARDGSGKNACCMVYVVEPVDVESITIPASKTIYVGKTYTFDPYIYPENATNQMIKWKSSDENIATIGMFTGKVEGISEGNVTITATSCDFLYDNNVNNNIQAYCDLNVVDRINIVKVIKDGNFFNVEFSTGRIWKSIGIDLTNASQMVYKDQWERYGYNKQTPFAEDELALIYLLDPLGMQYYMKYIGLYVAGMDLNKTLTRRDNVYEKIFGVKPQRFLLTNNGTKYIPDSSLPREEVYTDAELIFGSHPIYDAGDILFFSANIVLDLFGAVSSIFAPYLTPVSSGVQKIINALYYSASWEEAVNYLAVEQLTDYVDGKIEDVLGELLYKWPIGLLDMIGGWIESADEIFTLPENKNLIIYKRVNLQTNYRVLFIKGNYQMYIDDIVKFCEEHQ